MNSFDNAIKEADETLRRIQYRKKVISKLMADIEKRDHLDNEIKESVAYLLSVKNAPELTAVLNTLQGKDDDKACA